MPAYPTDDAWEYFLKHKDDIRAVLDDLLPTPRMEIPNTRGEVPSDEHAVRLAGKMPPQQAGEQRGYHHLAVRHKLDDFDQAVQDKNSEKLFNIMNDAWLRAPENRDVYSIPGFTEMCNLLDFTVEGFVDGERERDEEED